LIAPWFAELLAPVALATLAMVAAGWLLDPAGHASRALRWSLRTLPCLMAWLAISVACMLLASLTPLAHSVDIFLIPVALVMWPFVFLRPDVVRNDRPPLFWWPAWPGLAAVAASILALVVAAGFDKLVEYALDRIPAAWPSWTVVLPVGLITWATFLALTVFALSTSQHRWSWTKAGEGASAPRLLSGMRVLSAFDLQWLLLSLLLFYAAMSCLPVVIDAATSHLQQVTHSQVSRNPPTPGSGELLVVRAADFFVAYW